MVAVGVGGSSDGRDRLSLGTAPESCENSQERKFLPQDHPEAHEGCQSPQKDPARGWSGCRWIVPVLALEKQEDPGVSVLHDNAGPVKGPPVGSHDPEANGIVLVVLVLGASGAEFELPIQNRALVGRLFEHVPAGMDR